MTIAITGAAGHLGRLTAQLVLDRAPADEVVLVTRRPDEHRRPRRGGRDRPPRRLRRARCAAAGLRGRRPPAAHQRRRGRPARRQHTAAVAAAAAAGVGHVIYTSIVNAGSELPLVVSHEHGATEQAIRDRGLRWTALRNGHVRGVPGRRRGARRGVGHSSCTTTATGRPPTSRARTAPRRPRRCSRPTATRTRLRHHGARAGDPGTVRGARLRDSPAVPSRRSRSTTTRRRRASSPPACRPRPPRPTRRSARPSAKACWAA